MSDEKVRSAQREGHIDWRGLCASGKLLGEVARARSHAVKPRRPQLRETGRPGILAADVPTHDDPGAHPGCPPLVEVEFAHSSGKEARDSYAFGLCRLMTYLGLIDPAFVNSSPPEDLRQAAGMIRQKDMHPYYAHARGAKSPDCDGWVHIEIGP